MTTSKQQQDPEQPEQPKQPDWPQSSEQQQQPASPPVEVQQGDEMVTYEGGRETSRRKIIEDSASDADASTREQGSSETPGSSSE